MKVSITDDFDPGRIETSGQCFRWTRIGEDTRRILHRDRCLYITSLGGGLYEAECTGEEWDRVWAAYFDLDTCYSVLRGRIDPETDPFLFAAAEEGKGIRILRQDPFEMLITFIISQNRNIPAIRRSVDMLCTLCGGEKTDVRGLPYRAFPTPEAIAGLTEAQLKECRLGYRWDYVRRAAAEVRDGRVDLAALAALPCGEAVTRLTDMYGVGIKVASCVALFGLHQTDAFPRDVWIKRALSREYPEGFPCERYRPFNGLYQQYIFAYYRQHGGKEHRDGRH